MFLNLLNKLSPPPNPNPNPPKPLCIFPSWIFLQKMSLQEVGPTPPFQAAPGRVPGAQAQSPGAGPPGPRLCGLDGGLVNPGLGL